MFLISDIKIHKAAPHEIDTVHGIIEEYCNAIGVLIRDDRNQLMEYFNPGSGIWLASDAKEIIGCVVLRPLPAKEKACEVKRLYVRPSYRGMGLADKLMDALETYAISQNYCFAYLDSKDDLQAAVRFYRQRGYVDCERYNENLQATIFMRRKLI